ncbi:cysteine--1-D-myo-inosityl 2-amino-2-deoxy-alpha-D-glucopyranoside ligase [Kocuria palustris]|uniref:cysteine--1-D-myo-inosityl 2-amino-2-deoxy-alpha-D-glucopyranoside ligase n=1 Tax=Kocuria palustris TaxID=71999 RepID=UPI0011A44EDF|nr:cysteine--1-D-myo-inosityl 2-amino-2-deoxy-alpha-D-glucopyranoside ligase [Kocuria palustris]
MQSWSARTVPELPGEAAPPSVFDSRTGRIEQLPRQERASLYVCGITPYDATHLGHASTYVAFDLLHRAWLDAGMPVDYVQNVTDVDDPLLERAERDGVDWRQLAASQTDLFREDMAALNVLPPQHYVGATETVDWVVEAVEGLLERGLAYRVPGSDGEPDGDVYFDVRAVAGAGEDIRPVVEPAAEGETSGAPGPWSLGQISGMSRDEMLEVFGERGGDPQRPGKRDIFDPLLWRVERPGEPAWDGGSLGSGRPGWHIECSLISLRLLPAPFTVQGGGSDLVFPHHEMGAGHSWALSARPMARHFVHTGMVGLDGRKMSKSLGNLELVSRLRERGVEPAAIRLGILDQHYRDDWSWSQDVLVRAEARLARWRMAAETAAEGSFEDALEAVRTALAADLDTPRAIEAIDVWAEGVLVGGEQKGSGDPLAARAIEARLGIVL